MMMMMMMMMIFVDAGARLFAWSKKSARTAAEEKTVAARTTSPHFAW
jgi:hypothetical protein